MTYLTLALASSPRRFSERSVCQNAHVSRASSGRHFDERPLASGASALIRNGGMSPSGAGRRRIKDSVPSDVRPCLPDCRTFNVVRVAVNRLFTYF